MIGDIVLGPYQLGGFRRFLQAHVEYAVTAEKSIVDLHFRHIRHLFRGGGVPGHIDGAPVGEGQHIAYALRYIMPAVVSGLHRLYGDVAQVKHLMFAVLDRFLPGNDLTIWIPAFDTVHAVVVIVGVCDQNQISGQIVAPAHIRVDVDHLSLAGHHPHTGLPLVEQLCRIGDGLCRFVRLNRLHLGGRLHFNRRWSGRCTTGRE